MFFLSTFLIFSNVVLPYFKVLVHASLFHILLTLLSLPFDPNAIVDSAECPSAANTVCKTRA